MYPAFNIFFQNFKKLLLDSKEIFYNKILNSFSELKKNIYKKMTKTAKLNQHFKTNYRTSDRIFGIINIKINILNGTFQCFINCGQFILRKEPLKFII